MIPTYNVCVPSYPRRFVKCHCRLQHNLKFGDGSILAQNKST